jgi:hypothetical protein
MTEKTKENKRPFDPMGKIDFTQEQKNLSIYDAAIDAASAETYKCMVITPAFEIKPNERRMSQLSDLHRIQADNLSKINWTVKTLNLARDLIKKYNLPIDHSGHTGQKNEKISFSGIRVAAKEDLIKLQTAHRLAVFRNNEIKMGVNLQPIDERTIIADIAECQRVIKAVDAIEKEFLNS